MGLPRVPLLNNHNTMATVQLEATGVQTAVAAALKFFKEAFRELKPQGVQLEEVDRSEDGRFWLITVGYDDPSLVGPLAPRWGASSSAKALRARSLRQYKVIKVDAFSGRPISAKIRQ